MAETTGARIAALRKLRGFSQRGLAARAHVSYSLLTKVESGHAPATPALIGAVARALKIDVPRITGQPYQEPTRQMQQLQAGIETLRRVLLTRDLPPENAPPPRPVEALRADVEETSRLTRQARYVKLGQVLPSLLEELSIAVADDDRPELHGLLAVAYGGVSALAHKIGYLDLRSVALDRIERESLLSGDPLRIARTKWSRGASLLAVSAYEQGLRLMEQTRRDLGDTPERMEPAAVSVYGSLHLRSSVLAARAGNGDLADEHLREAARAAELLPSPAPNHYGMEFGPSNVAVHAVSAAVELENGPLAVERSLPLYERFPADLPPERAGRHWIDVARGWYFYGDRHRAFEALRRARRVSPQQARLHPMVRELVQTIAAAEPRSNEGLRAFASWLGLA
ncbi:helix-turn-helix transcriptional regulator [Actinomadura keratinilytica]|jgi:transcriptional regulator with XRE-family HTH domain|uniref:HTH cro/C1-type domain-containing protein n=1 Tax=Actinomadura keratinilytica TaxID=547461 RepID=A0ABP7YJF2_9ACTN